MGRNSILEQGGGEQEQEQETDSRNDSESESEERVKTTVRMSEELKGLVDERADELGLSYNAAVCMILSKELK